jgi:transposase
LSGKEPILLQHDNARPHISAAASAVVESIRFEVVPHPPYNPDLTPSDLYLLGVLKKHLKGSHFSCEEVKAAMAK